MRDGPWASRGRRPEQSDHEDVRRDVPDAGRIHILSKLLTVLTCPDLVDAIYMDEDEDSDEALEESWTPRFRC